MAPLQLQQCHHRDNISLPHTLLYCLSLSTFFVCSLYVFVPASIRRLPRDHVLHIKWRTGVIVGVMIVGVGIYPWLWCQHVNDMDASNAAAALSGFHPWYRYLGFSWQPIQDVKIAIHVLILYLGALMCSWLKIYNRARILHWEKERPEKNNGQSLRFTQPKTTVKQLPRIPKPKYLSQSFQYTWMLTVGSFKLLRDDEDHRWMILRNLCVAPMTEEVIFRACLLPPLLVSRPTVNSKPLTPTQVSWIAPMFFGVAHLHHFYEKYRQLHPSQRTKKMVCRLLLVVAVQWTYTTLFGAYVSHVFVRTGSLSGVTLAHVICNYMGLPDVSFAHPTSNLHGYRWFIAIMYIFGIGLFVMGFDSVLFPKESVLPSLLQQNA